MINLPSLPMPNLPANINIPEMIHPLVVHFAIAIPVILLVLEIGNFIFRRKSLGFMNFILMILTFVVFVLAYYTGSVDAQNAKDLMSPEAKEVLQSHRNLGVFLIYGSVAILLIKIFGFASQKFVLKLLFFVGILAFIFGIFNEGKMGGQLVYKYGTNVMSHSTVAPGATKSSPVVTPAVTAPNAVEPQSTAPATEQAVPVNTQEKQPANTVKDAAKNVVNTVVGDVEKVAKEVTDGAKKTLEGAAGAVNGVIPGSTPPTTR